jgi:hypothetical protein
MQIPDSEIENALVKLMHAKNERNPPKRGSWRSE